MSAKQIFFRVDGDANLGLGHLVRCIALAQMLKSHFSIKFICKTIPLNVVNELAVLGFELQQIIDENEFLNCLRGEEIVVIDHYGLGSTYQKAVKALGSKLVCIDDVHDNFFFADLIINHAPNITVSDYNAQLNTQYALGLDYVLIRPVFLKKAQQHTARNNTIKTVFVCFGGSDIKNLTLQVVNILKTDDRFEKIVVVIGAAYQYEDILKQVVGTSDRILLYRAIDEEQMADLMIQSDLAIVPSSGILQEALAVGCRVISGMYVENQKDIFNDYKEVGAFISAENFSQNDIKQAIEQAFNNEFGHARRFIDGKSGGRLLRYFEQIESEKDIKLRYATEADLLNTFEWASNEELRKFFFNTNAVEFEDHKKWYYKKLNSEKCFYYLGLINEEVFGSVRFDIVGEEAIISYLVSPVYQNKGLGAILLKKGLDLFLTDVKDKICLVSGEVMPDNKASIKVFEKLGYLSQTNTLNHTIKFYKIIND